MKAAINTLDNTVVKRPSSKVNKERQNLCPDKGYDFQEIEVHVPIKDIYHIFDIEEKQSVIKINGGNNSKIKPIFAGAAISGLFAIFHDCDNYFRIKNVPDNKKSRHLLYDLGFGQLNGDVPSMKMTAMDSLAKNYKCSNVV